MKIRDMEMLVRVAESGSMTLAAQQLHMTTAAVSVAIARIEASIGLRLFERTTRALHPTDAGLVVIEGCVEAVSRWQRALDDARDGQTEIEGTVHLSAPSDTSYLILRPLLQALSSTHPKLRVVLQTSDDIHQLHRDAIDMAIRYGKLSDSSLMARKLYEGPRILVASPAYIARFGTPTNPAHLAAHRCVTLHLSNAPMVSWMLYAQDGTPHRVPIQSPLCGDGYLARCWAIDGLGIALKSLFDVLDDLEAGRLVQVLPAYTGGQVAIHALFPSRTYQPQRVRVVADAVAQRFAQQQDRVLAWASNP